MNRPHCRQVDACKAKGAGHCRGCTLKQMMADPAFQARRRAALAEAMTAADYRQRQSEGQKASLARKMRDPAFMEGLRERGRLYGAPNFAAANKAEARIKAVAAIKAKHLAWCPPEFWAVNADLKRNHIPLADRKRIIAEMIPGTVEHARVQIANAHVASRLKHERELREAY